ncbi:sarcosine oxidase subunit gamma [Starkeya sp. ORNL1]|uniref:sarcosine oxidase subunit gamma n=1 Tax=Starkeya sp. ORNL1 TaxID=2709380 RepID=UPI0014633E84|nr:sarcosine oxidase subunit gamma family protein [Starkeya sp. ORNL1]QJP14493.1 sarcosine oxidase subunit gamma [Starkeya sp. ORNL1]
MSTLLDRLPIDAMAPFGVYGRSGEPGVVAVVREDLAIATLAARHGTAGALKARVETAFGLTLADGPRAAGGPDLALLGTAPGRWLAVSQTRADLADELADALSEEAAITEQSDAVIAFDLAGPRVLDLLAKGVMVDLDPAVFKPGDVAVTDMAHIGATLWRTAETGYRVLVARSFAPAFSRFLVASAAEYGLRLDPGRG